MKDPLPTIISGRPQLNRRINMALVLDLIQQHGTLSRADLVKLTGIRATSMSSIVEHLIDEQLLRETGLGVSTGGRQPTLLELNPGGGYAVGVEVRRKSMHAILVNLLGEPVAREHIEPGASDPESVFDSITDVVARLCTQARIARKRLLGLGISVPGIISRDEGSVVLSRPLGWRNVSVQAPLHERLGVPVHVLNNATSAALAVGFTGGNHSTGSLLYLLVYLRQRNAEQLTEVGCGIVLDGRAYLGETHMAGEIRVDIPHPLALARRERASGTPRSLDRLIAASLETPAGYRACWETFARELGRVLAWGLDLLGPGRVVIGSDVDELESLVGATVRETAEANSMYQVLRETGVVDDPPRAHIAFSGIGPDDLALGAIIPHLVELSLAPRLRSSVLM